MFAKNPYQAAISSSSGTIDRFSGIRSKKGMAVSIHPDWIKQASKTPQGT